MKTCTKCNTRKPLDGFHKSSISKDGLHSHCKTCRRPVTAQAHVQKHKEIIQRLGVKCASPNCRWVNEDGTMGCTDIRILHIDHIHGGGSREYGGYHKGIRIRGHSRAQWYRIVLQMSDARLKDKYQTLCPNCNWLKRLENKENKRLIPSLLKTHNPS